MGHPRRRTKARHLGLAEWPPVRLPSIQAPMERESEEKPTPLPPEERVGYAVVGLGRLALEQVLPALRSSMSSRLSALVSGDPEKAARVAAAYGISPQSIYDYQSFDRIRDDPKIEAVYIATPNALHPEHAIRAAEAGKHVLCEKPMANSVADCDAMIAAAADAQRLLMIAYRLQYEPHHRAAIDIVRRETLGAAKLIEAVNVQHQGDPRQWRLRRALAGGGALPDIGIYCLSAARYLTGEEPIEISATAYSTPGDPRFREVEETVSFNLRFPSGVMAVCSTSYGAHESRRFRMMAENGWVDLDPAFSYGGLRMHVGRKRDEAVEEVSEQRREERSQFAREIDHFSECVRSGRRPHTPGEEGRQDVLLMEAIYAAARRGRPVRLPALKVLDAFRGPPPDID